VDSRDCNIYYVRIANLVVVVVVDVTGEGGVPEY
jgi:hypothetical protein